MDYQRRKASEGLDWLTDGFRLVKPWIWIWMGIVLLVGAVQMVVAMIPMLGGLVSAILTPILLGGLLASCRSMAHGQAPELPQLLLGFRERAKALALLGVANIGLGFLVMIFMVIGAIVLATVTGLAGEMGSLIQSESHDEKAMEALLVSAGGVTLLLVLMILGLLAFVPVTMAVWFAPALIFFRGMGVIAALKASFFSCLGNILPLTVYGVLAFVAITLGMMVLLVGVIPVAAVLVAAHFMSYRAIWGDEGILGMDGGRDDNSFK